jgi:CheY-like chemotaxis protein
MCHGRLSIKRFFYHVSADRELISIFSHFPAMSAFDDPHRLRVLLVEDEWLIREMLADVLEEAGFATRQALSAPEALRLLRRDPTVDLVVTDVEMPGVLDGIDLARRLATQRPDIGVLVVSGRRPRALPLGARFLAKPFMPAELLQALGAMIPASVSVAS